MLAAGTGGGEVLPVAVLAVQLALLLHEAIFHQGGVAVGAGEFLRVPRQTHGHEEGASGGRAWRKELIYISSVILLAQVGWGCVRLRSSTVVPLRRSFVVRFDLT